MNPIKILIADSNEIIREGIKAILSKNVDFIITGEAENRKKLFSEITRTNPDVLIIDYSTFTLEDIKNLPRNGCSPRIMCITNQSNTNTILKVLETGVNSHLFKDCDSKEIIEAVYATAKGEKFFCGKVLEALAEKDQESFNASFSCQAVNISSRELEIIRLIAEGFTNKEIADKLCLSNHTVTTHRKNIMNKLGINNTAGLVMFAIKENLIETPV